MNNKANESISKFKLLSAYGGPGSLIHTQYGSIIVSCIEEWGFIVKIIKFIKDREQFGKDDKYVKDQCDVNNISLSNDARLMRRLIKKKGLDNLEFLVNIPNIEINDFGNTIKGEGRHLAINSSFMPKIFFDKGNYYKPYSEWYDKWNKEKKFFSPPKYIGEHEYEYNLMQDNIVLICKHGHISDFPWSQYLSYRLANSYDISENVIDLFSYDSFCGNSGHRHEELRIINTKANASGFESKTLKCMKCKKSVSLKGLMNLRIKCNGDKPWENSIGKHENYYGDKNSRDNSSVSEKCANDKGMKIALTTGNNICFTRLLSSIYLPDHLFLSELELENIKLENEINESVKNKDYAKAAELQVKLKELNVNKVESNYKENLSEEEYRYQEYRALLKITEDVDINREDFVVKDVTKIIKGELLEKYFSKILRLDKIKLTSAQLDFSREFPVDEESNNVKSMNIFRGAANSIVAYPVVENYGEGIFFSFNNELIDLFKDSRIEELINNLSENDSFSKSMIQDAKEKGCKLYLVHTFCHLIMKELEFRCGYPTASLSERIYVSNKDEYKMYACMIYTTEGAEGSMGGLISQTRKENLLGLIESALKRAIVCNSDPLCWESRGQGLLSLNFASCFSCSLVSETSCELRNCYLDRRVLIDDEYGFFSNILKC